MYSIVTVQYDICRTDLSSKYVYNYYDNSEYGARTYGSSFRMKNLKLFQFCLTCYASAASSVPCSWRIALHIHIFKYTILPPHNWTIFICSCNIMLLRTYWLTNTNNGHSKFLRGKYNHRYKYSIFIIKMSTKYETNFVRIRNV